MSVRNEWRYCFIRYEINYYNKEECIYINGKLNKKRPIHGGFLGFFQSNFLLDFVNELGKKGWELQSELGTTELRNLTFKKLVVGRDEDEDFEKDEDSTKQNIDKGKSNKKLVVGRDEDEDFEKDEDSTKQNIDKGKSNRELRKLNNELFQFRDKTIYSLNAIEKSLEGIQSKLERISQDELISPKGMDYRYLHNLLSIGNWREADKETYRILLKAFHGEKLEWLTEKNIKQIPNEDLLIINRLWMQHSNGRFSYSTQKRLLEDLSVRLDSDKRALYLINEEFGSLVGWRCDFKWLKYQQLTFKLSAPEGHLPTVQVGWHEKGDWLRYVQFLSRKIF